MLASDCGADFVAQNHGDWWTIQVLCGPVQRAYAIRKEDGQLMELPDDRCPFVVFDPAATLRQGR